MNKFIFLILICLFNINGFAQEENKLILARQTWLNKNFKVEANGLVKVAFFDADSTLRVAPSKSVSANSPTDVAILPEVSANIARLVGEGYLIAIVSNQRGVEFGHISFETADAALKYTIELIAKENSQAIIHYYDFAEKNGPDIKPNIGMFERLKNKLTSEGMTLDMVNSKMIGDSAYKKGVDFNMPDRANGGVKEGIHFSNADRLFAMNAGIKFEDPADAFNWWGLYKIEGFPDYDSLTNFYKTHSATGN